MAVLDELDLKIVHALQLDGRAPFNRVAEVLDVSDQTVARRYARLRSEHGIRVVGSTDPALLGETSWFVRVKCLPHDALAVAKALARRPETSWVKLVSGGTEIVCVVRGRPDEDAPAVLLDHLPRTRRVVDVTANCVLHVFFGGPRSVVDVLSPAQVAALTPHVEPGRRVVLDDADLLLLAILRRDGRTRVSAIHTETGLPPTTIRRRVEELRVSGALYFDVDLDYGLLPTGMQTLLWLSAAPERLVAAGQALAAHPEVPFAAATTGATNLYASVLSADPAALFTYLTTRVADLPATRVAETAPVLRSVKGL
ncbi:Lrp/AsnC family transcriptional regulator [Umezawaea sp. Da 62-37]|uniref:Lrp/AsnC family transcriptional regulator n=1 Tax=Umezawaea sp. Da 62-37 TaxID=3075927 RepID=UPI0028F6F770|nr:Lrp/AsnC family transcriptional regulator [Umezawaea sp. Da 62-37]WNV84398.1 Lrp/AsnC family transcriptional regulator [Umezawaea sp. Da 62-37]